MIKGEAHLNRVRFSFYQGRNYFLSAPRMVKTVVPQTVQGPFKAGLPFFVVTRWGSFISVFFLHFTQ